MFDRPKCKMKTCERPKNRMIMSDRPINKMKMFYTPYNVLYINISLEIKGVPYTTGRQLFKISWTFWSYDVCM
jgi:hypothetical protein